MSSSPFLANQVMRQVSADYADKYPLATPLVKTNYYVDDCLAGAATVEEAYETVMQSIAMTSEACLSLQKWRSNSRELLDRIPEHLRESSDPPHQQIAPRPSDCTGE